MENKDFFLIRDACHTELEPEEFDENGEGMTLTCIGFPLPDEIAHQISHKFHLYRVLVRGMIKIMPAILL